MARILLLGGTGEGAALASLLTRRRGYEVISSLAGRTRAPAALPGRVRSGGFGGPKGLVGFLKAERIDALVDATHPFAAQMAANAAAACAAAGVPLVKLLRPPWRPQPGDDWTSVPDLEAAAAALPPGARALLAIGSQGLAPFAHRRDVTLLARVAESPAGLLPAEHAEPLVQRGPFDPDSEEKLLRERAITHIVCKNSGGEASAAKLTAARRLKLPVIMIERPPLPEGETVADIEAVVDWLRETLGV